MALIYEYSLKSHFPLNPPRGTERSDLTNEVSNSRLPEDRLESLLVSA